MPKSPFVMLNSSGAGVTPTAGNWRAVVLPQAKFFATINALQGALANLATS